MTGTLYREKGKYFVMGVSEDGQTIKTAKLAGSGYAICAARELGIAVIRWFIY